MRKDICFDKLVELVDEAVVFIDEFSRIVFANQNFLSISEYELEEIQGVSSRKLITSQEKDSNAVFLKNKSSTLINCTCKKFNLEKNDQSYVLLLKPESDKSSNNTSLSLKTFEAISHVIRQHLQKNLAAYELILNQDILMTIEERLELVQKLKDDSIILTNLADNIQIALDFEEDNIKALDYNANIYNLINKYYPTDQITNKLDESDNLVVKTDKHYFSLLLKKLFRGLELTYSFSGNKSFVLEPNPLDNNAIVVNVLCQVQLLKENEHKTKPNFNLYIAKKLVKLLNGQVNIILEQDNMLQIKISLPRN